MKVKSRLPEEAGKVLLVLQQEGEMNKETLSLSAGVKRAVLDHVAMQLYALGFIQIETEGKNRMCELTSLGSEFLDLVKEAG